MIDIDKERQAFEEWMLKTSPPSSIVRNPDGSYGWTLADMYWRAWQARAQQGAA
jgi:hypothetical protein